MAPPGASPVFIDANILIYSTFAASPLYGIARARLREFEFESRFEIADDHAEVTALLMELVRTHKVRGKQIHDANIAATMCCHNIRYLLTNNPIDFLRYESGIAVLPLCA